MERDPDTRIHKYPIAIADEFTIKMPKGSVILHVAMQTSEDDRVSTVDRVKTVTEKPCMWVRVNRVAPEEERKFYLVGTGHPMPVDAAYHVGTIQHGEFIWHLFEGER